MKRISFTDDMHDTVLTLRKKTGVGAHALVSGWDSKPKGLSATIIWFWIHRRVKTVDPMLFKAVLAYWESFDESVPITPKMHKALLAERDRVGIGAEPLLKYTDCVIPDKLAVSSIKRWMSGQTCMINLAHYNFVMAAYAKLTEEEVYRLRHLDKPNNVELTEEIKSELVRLRRDSGIGPMRLLRSQANRPEGLTSSTIASWQNPSVKTTKKHYLSFVLKAWRNTERRIPITSKMVHALGKEFKRTGVFPSRLLRICPNLQSKITLTALSALKNGTRKAIEEEIWNSVLLSLSVLPDVAASQKKSYTGRMRSAPIPSVKTKSLYESNHRADLRALTSKELKELERHIQRTRVTPASLFKSFPDDIPPMLSAGTISQWRSGNIKRTSPERIEWVLEKLASLPDKSK